MSTALPVTEAVARAVAMPPGGVVAAAPVELPTPVISLQPNAAGTLFQEATGASATTAAGDTDIADTVVDAVVADQYFTAPSEGDGPTVTVVSGLTTLAVAGASVLTDDSDALTFAGPTTVFALVKGSNQRLFAFSEEYRSSPRIISGAWQWYDSAGSLAPICTGDASVWHVLMIERIPWADAETPGSLTGRYNNGGELTIVPFDDRLSVQGIAFFIQALGGGGNFTGSVARLDIIDGVLTNAQKTAYHDVFASLGSGIIGT